MLLSLKDSEARALRRELSHVGGDAQLEAVKAKLDRALDPVPDVLPGQTSIDDYLGGDSA